MLQKNVNFNNIKVLLKGKISKICVILINFMWRVV